MSFLFYRSDMCYWPPDQQSKLNSPLWGPWIHPADIQWCWWCERKSQGIAKVRHIHSSRTESVCTESHGHQSNSCRGIPVWTGAVDHLTNTAVPWATPPSWLKQSRVPIQSQPKCENAFSHSEANNWVLNDSDTRHCLDDKWPHKNNFTFINQELHQHI